jgi:uncharacterized membrane protein
MIFSIGYFVMGVLNLRSVNLDATYQIFTFLNNYHIFEFSLIFGLVFSIIQNYRRVDDSEKMLYKIIFLVGWDYAFVLLGVFASQLVLMAFTYTKDHHLHLVVGLFAGVVIIVNLCRKPLLDFLACKLH